MSFGTEITKEMLIAIDREQRELLYKGRGRRKPKTESRKFKADCGSTVELTYTLLDSRVTYANSNRLYCSFDCKACKAKIEQATKIIEKSIDNVGLLSVM